MNTITRACMGLLLFLLPAAKAALPIDGELRLALGDDLQEKRTTSLNWPMARPRRPAPEKIARAPLAPAIKEPIVVAADPKRFRVLIDVGHGGHDDGAPGPFGIMEKELCLRIASGVKSRLERAANLADFQMDVRLSRAGDHFIPLRDRARQANDWSADLFISIHANSSPVARARGFEVYFLSNEASDEDASRIARQENGEAPAHPLSAGVLSILSDLKTNTHILESSRFAESVYASLASFLRPNGKGVRQAPFTVLSGTQMPALLIEVGYLTNAEEASALNRPSYQQRIASGVADGVLGFALRMRRVGKAPAPRLGNKRTT